MRMKQNKILKMYSKKLKYFNCSMKYVIELQPECWIANWDGDPPRTLKIENAKIFNSITPKGYKSKNNLQRL